MEKVLDKSPASYTLTIDSETVKGTLGTISYEAKGANLTDIRRHFELWGIEFLSTETKFTCKCEDKDKETECRG